jgi:AraC-like DNA-binding protein
VHAGVRTLSRLFAAETGLSFAQWRTRIRIRAAIEHLAEGASVNATARAVGYRKPDAFIAAFRRATGQTPGTYTGADARRQGLPPAPPRKATDAASGKRLQPRPLEHVAGYATSCFVCAARQSMITPRRSSNVGPRKVLRS